MARGSRILVNNMGSDGSGARFLEKKAEEEKQKHAISSSRFCLRHHRKFSELQQLLGTFPPRKPGSVPVGLMARFCGIGGECRSNALQR